MISPTTNAKFTHNMPAKQKRQLLLNFLFYKLTQLGWSTLYEDNIFVLYKYLSLADTGTYWGLFRLDLEYETCMYKKYRVEDGKRPQAYPLDGIGSDAEERDYTDVVMRELCQIDHHTSGIQFPLFEAVRAEQACFDAPYSFCVAWYTYFMREKAAADADGRMKNILYEFRLDISLAEAIQIQFSQWLKQKNKEYKELNDGKSLAAFIGISQSTFSSWTDPVGATPREMNDIHKLVAVFGFEVLNVLHLSSPAEDPHHVLCTKQVMDMFNQLPKDAQDMILRSMKLRLIELHGNRYPLAQLDL